MGCYEMIYKKIQKDRAELAKAYDTDESKIVYIGNNKYIVVTRDGKEIRI